MHMPVRKVWHLKRSTPETTRLAREANLSPLQAHLLVNRGILKKDAADSFLDPRLATLPNPMQMEGMILAASTIITAIERPAPITIYGDYDADGLTSAALLHNFFRELGLQVSCYIPDRLKEGYGLNCDAIRKIAEKGKGLILTVDCGISNAAEIELAKTLGLEIVITDHHQIPPEFKPVCPVVNPHQWESSSSTYQVLAGVGVAFFLAGAIRTLLREKDWFRRRKEPDLRKYLDLVALGTLADRVPLVGLNRVLVSNGIRSMGWNSRPGMQSMMQVCGIEPGEVNDQDVAFQLAPMVNAPGRLGAAEISLNLLTTRDGTLAGELAEKAKSANRRRRHIERAIVNEIEGRIRSEPDLIDGRRTLCFGGEEWHRGVLGIVASRLVDKYHRPALVFSLQDDIAVGSGRSLDGFDLYNALDRMREFIEKYGGHTHAAGLTLSRKNFPILGKKLEDYARTTMEDPELFPKVEIDACLSLEEITPSVSEQLACLAPFGEANPEPVFLSPEVEVVSSRIVGEGHLKIAVRQGERVFECIGFGLSGHHSLEGKRIRLVFSLQINRWRGHKKLELRIVDLEERGKKSKVILEDSGGEIDIFGTEDKEGFFTAGKG
ncbi:MAG: single-stranded-DNA-specific exonuclease RecJ [Desulfatiglandaceae bacterium]